MLYRTDLALGRLPVWLFLGLPQLLRDLGGTCRNLIAQLDFVPHFSERGGEPLDLCFAALLERFILRTFRSFQSIPQILRSAVSWATDSCKPSR